MKINHLEVVTVTATAPGAGGAAGAAVTGDSLVVKNGNGRAMVLSAWADFQGAGLVSIVNPSGHDTTRGFRPRVTASEVELLLPMGVGLPVKAQETLGVTIVGSAVAGDVEQLCLLMGYEQLPGVNQRKIGWAELNRRMEKLLTIEATITAAAGPGYSGEELITAESDLLQANREYAVIGAVVGIEAGCVYLRGPDTGNARIAVPANDLDPSVGSAFFATLSRAFDAELIPVINSGNKASTFIGCHQDENATAITCSWNLALLK